MDPCERSAADGRFDLDDTLAVAAAIDATRPPRTPDTYDAPEWVVVVPAPPSRD